MAYTTWMLQQDLEHFANPAVVIFWIFQACCELLSEPGLVINIDLDFTLSKTRYHLNLKQEATWGISCSWLVTTGLRLILYIGFAGLIVTYSFQLSLTFEFSMFLSFLWCWTAAHKMKNIPGFTLYTSCVKTFHWELQNFHWNCIKSKQKVP